MPDTLEPPSPPAPTSSIQVSSMPQPVAPAESPKPGSARDRLFSELRKRSKPSGAPDTEPQQQQQKTEARVERPTTEVETPDDTDIEPSEQPSDQPQQTEQPTTEQTPTTPTEKKKLSPWKLVDQLKKDLVEARKTNALPEKERTELMERASKAEQRAKEMEEELRWYNTEKYDPDVKRAGEEYERAWGNAMNELKELTITDAQGERPISAEDVLELVNLPLAKAREMAVNLYGAFADDVMAHRKEIRRLFDTKQQKMDELRKTSAERDRKRQEEAQRFQSESSKLIKETWDKSNEAIKTDPKVGRYFTPVEGNDEVNQRLAKGFELVDRAFSENPLDPKLTPEQRTAVVKRHAAVRNRAASWGRVVYENQQLQSQIESLKKELSQFRSSQPSTGGQSGSSTPATPMSAKDSIFAELRKRAH